jgi:glycosyltransferase involved in cell wall biosynthesis
METNRRQYPATKENAEPAVARVSLSVIVPVYNEQYLVEEALQQLWVLEDSPLLDRIQVIVVDDGSTDSTGDVLRRLEEDRRRESGTGGQKMQWRFLRHPHNLGKGKCIQTALEHADCDVTAMYDADLEYHPRDLLRIMEVFTREHADAVFGSRFAGGEYRRALLYHHELGNRFITSACNLVSNLNLTDIHTCFKAIRTQLFKSIPLVSEDFRIEPEIVIKLAKRGARIFEIPISYSGRTFAEGKKADWRAGLKALGAIVRFGASDEIYRADPYGSQILARLSRAPRFNAWMADIIRGFCGDTVLEIGSGVGNLTKRLTPRAKYVSSDINPLYLDTLSNLREGRPYLEAKYCDVTDLSSFVQLGQKYDTVICLNVIEHVGDDRAALRNIASVLRDGGRAVILVPQGPWNYGTLDEVLGHERRYTRETLTELATDCGLEVEEMIEFNRIGTAAWWLNGKVLRRRTFGLGQILALNALTPLFRKMEPALPLPGLSLIAVLRR